MHNPPWLGQARVAQNGGAAALIVMDHTCLCSDKDCEPTKPCQDERPEIPDDGTGADINIPTVLVRKEAGDQFKETLEKDGVGILMELRFDYMSDPGKIDYHIWTTPTDSLSRYLIRSTSLETLAGAFAEHNVIFIPHQFLYPGHIYLSCGQEHNGTAGVSSSSGQEKACDELCTNDGRYCAISDLNHNISGAEIVTESLRRICIRETHQADKGVIWWKYARSHQTQCYNHEPTLFSDPKCIERVMKEAGINIHSVNDCMEKSGGTTGTAANTKLDEEILAQMRHGVVQHPWASINRRLTDKAPLPMDTLQLLCDELEYKPTPCHHCAWCYDDPIGCVQLGSCEAARKRKNDKPTKNKPKGGGFWRFLKVVFWTTLVGGAGYAAWLYSHSNAGSVPMLSNNFRDQARGVLTDYMQLNSEDDPIQQHEEFMMQQQQPFGS